MAFGQVAGTQTEELPDPEAYNPVEQNMYVVRPDPSELKVTADLVMVPPLNIVSVATLIRK